MEPGFTFADFLSFEKLIAPKILKIVYWLGIAGMTIFAIVAFFGSFAMMSFSAASGLGTMILSILGWGFGVLMWRVMIEIYIVFFGVYERLGAIREALKKD